MTDTSGLETKIKALKKWIAESALPVVADEARVAIIEQSDLGIIPDGSAHYPMLSKSYMRYKYRYQHGIRPKQPEFIAGVNGGRLQARRNKRLSTEQFIDAIGNVLADDRLTGALKESLHVEPDTADSVIVTVSDEQADKLHGLVKMRRPLMLISDKTTKRCMTKLRELMRERIQ